ncbi:hypothetical protein D3C72_1149850 [compost metagenome]
MQRGFGFDAQMARKVDRGKQQIAHLLFQAGFIHHRLLSFIHHFVDLFVHFVEHRAKRGPVKAHGGATLLNFMRSHQGRQT